VLNTATAEPPISVHPPPVQLVGSRLKSKVKEAACSVAGARTSRDTPRARMVDLIETLLREIELRVMVSPNEGIVTR
jgi:hypothetical protein